MNLATICFSCPPPPPPQPPPILAALPRPHRDHVVCVICSSLIASGSFIANRPRVDLDVGVRGLFTPHRCLVRAAAFMVATMEKPKQNQTGKTQAEPDRKNSSRTRQEKLNQNQTGKTQAEPDRKNPSRTRQEKLKQNQTGKTQSEPDRKNPSRTRQEKPKQNHHTEIRPVQTSLFCIGLPCDAAPCDSGIGIITINNSN